MALSADAAMTEKEMFDNKMKEWLKDHLFLTISIDSNWQSGSKYLNVSYDLTVDDETISGGSGSVNIS